MSVGCIRQKANLQLPDPEKCSFLRKPMSIGSLIYAYSKYIVIVLSMCQNCKY